MQTYDDSIEDWDKFQHAYKNKLIAVMHICKSRTGRPIHHPNEQKMYLHAEICYFVMRNRMRSRMRNILELNILTMKMIVNKNRSKHNDDDCGSSK